MIHIKSKNNEIKLCSIDSSTKKTGIAFFIGGEYICHDLLDCSTKTNMNERFMDMSFKIWQALTLTRPDIIYVEETVVLRNAQTQRFLTRLQGVIYAWCMNKGCEFNTIRPTVWRSAIGMKQGKSAKRAELKEQSIQYVRNKYGVDVTDDEADAICIGDAVINLYGGGESVST